MTEISDEDAHRSLAGSAAKKRKVDSATRNEYDFELKELMAWLEKMESTLEMLTKETSTSPQEEFTVEEQLVLVQVCLKTVTDLNVKAMRIDSNDFKLIIRSSDKLTF